MILVIAFKEKHKITTKKKMAIDLRWSLMEFVLSFEF
jgi:hypothetical protein